MFCDSINIMIYKKQTQRLGWGRMGEEEKDIYLHPTHILPTSCSVNKVLRIAGSVVWTTPNLSSVNDAATKWDKPQGQKKKVKSELKVGKSICNISIWQRTDLLNI